MMIQQAQARGDLSVEAGCEALEVSASGYYAWCGREISRRQQADTRLGDEIERVFVASRRTYGSQRVWLGLREQGIRTSRKRVARLMRQRGLRSIRARQRRLGLTKVGQSAYFAPNLLNQDFNATHKNQKWVTDTTYIPTHQGAGCTWSACWICSVVRWWVGRWVNIMMLSWRPQHWTWRLVGQGQPQA